MQLILRPGVGPTEFGKKAERLRSMLGQGVTVKVVVRVRGRETLAAAAKTLRRMVTVAEEAGAEVGGTERREAEIGVRVSPQGHS
jgi:translation initiation factor IF-3